MNAQGSAAPGFSPERICALIRKSIDRTGLDLSGMTILTEAATGVYGVTAAIAALAGAQRVVAVGRSSPYGTAEQAAQWTLKLARLCGAVERVSVLNAIPDNLDDVDIVTNSGHLRPLDADVVSKLPARCVIGLMFEAWEFRESDIDARACKARRIPIVGVNERHSSVDVFSYLGPLCVRLLHGAGLSVYGNRIALLCDNAFSYYIVRSLQGLGALVSAFEGYGAIPPDAWDSVLVALSPASKPRIGRGEAKRIAQVAPGAVLAQLWGDLDRNALEAERVPVWPARSPKPGHMAMLLSEIGPEPIIRLQAGGLRAAEWVYRHGAITPSGIAQLVSYETSAGASPDLAAASGPRPLR